MITVNQLKQLGVRSTAKLANAASLLDALNQYGASVGLDKPHRLVHFLAQVFHESGAFQYDEEIASGAAYEGRKDLGNTQPGDGKRFKGRGPIQLTGRANYRAFTAWARKITGGITHPDFEKNPELVKSDPWEGLSAIWYWDAGNPTGKSLNRYADENNIEMITRRINGGLNGYADRLAWFDKIALVTLGYAPDAVIAFQRASSKYLSDVDGISGPKTRAAMAAALMSLSGAIPAPNPPIVIVEPTPPPATVPQGFWDSLFAAIAKWFKNKG